MFRDIRQGMVAIPEGFAFFKKHPSTLLYAIAPFIINILALGVGIWLLTHYYQVIYLYFIGLFGIGADTVPVGFWQHMLHGLEVAFTWILKGVIFLVGTLMLLFATFIVSMIVAAPFNDALSEKVESLVTGAALPPFAFKTMIKSALRSVQVETMKIVVWIVALLLGALVNLIPIAGNIIYIIYANAFSMWQMGWMYTDYPMSRRLTPFTARLAFARKFTAAHMGLGVVFFIPFFGFIFGAPLVVAGTLLFLRLDHDRQVRHQD